MKLHFEPNLDYQLQAIEAVCGVFHGQKTCRTEFTVTWDVADMQQRMGFAENDLGINPLFPATGPATSSFNGLHPKSNFLAMRSVDV